MHNIHNEENQRFMQLCAAYPYLQGSSGNMYISTIHELNKRNHVQVTTAHVVRSHTYCLHAMHLHVHLLYDIQYTYIPLFNSCASVRLAHACPNDIPKTWVLNCTLWGVIMSGLVFTSLYFDFCMVLPEMTQLTRKSPIALRLILRGSPGPTA